MKLNYSFKIVEEFVPLWADAAAGSAGILIAAIRKDEQLEIKLFKKMSVHVEQLEAVSHEIIVGGKSASFQTGRRWK